MTPTVLLLLMDAKDVARGFLRQFVNRAPQSSDIEITLVESQPPAGQPSACAGNRQSR